MDQTSIIVELEPLVFDLEAIGSKLRIQPGQTKFTDRLAKLAEEAKTVAKPKAVARLCGLDFLDDERLRVDDVVFTSPLLRENMGKLGRAFPYLATEGLELAEWSQALSSSLDRVFSTGLREAAVKQYESMLEKKITEQYGIEQVSAMNPGSLEAWPLTQQEPFFQLMDPLPKQLGMTLLPSLMMSPQYSVSGIFFQTDTKYYNCQLCPREECPNRKAPSTVI